MAALDEEYIARMEDVLAVYERPLAVREPVVLHAEVRPPVAMRPGQVAKRDGEYRRCGTANVFCGVQPKAGRHFTKVTPTRSSPEFADYLLDVATCYPEADTIHLVMDNLSSQQPKAGRHFTKVTPTRSSPEFADYLLDVATCYPEADTIHLVMDNLSSHTRKALVERFGEKDGNWLWERFTVHYTPKHGSWLNQAEIAIRLFSRQCLGRRRIADRATLRNETRAWNCRVNRDQVPIQWNFTRHQARNKFGYTITRSRY